MFKIFTLTATALCVIACIASLFQGENLVAMLDAACAGINFYCYRSERSN